jgi:hypothetical protein
MSYSIELRNQVHNINNIDDFFLFVKEHKDNKKVYAFCFYTFLEKLCKENTKEAIKFLELSKNNTELSPMIVKIMSNMLGNKGI